MALQTPTRATSDQQKWPPQQGDWTYADYARLPESSFRYEIVRGELHMSPAPSIQHQRAISALIAALAKYLETKQEGEVLPSPIDVNLSEGTTVVQPDLIYVSAARPHILAKQTVEGPPDLVIEVLSPRTAQYDRVTKFQIYAEAGVREYWLVDPDACTIEIFVLRGQAYAPLGQFSADEQTVSEVLPDFSVAVRDVCFQ